MYKFITSRAWRLSVAVILLLTLFPLTASAQEPEPGVQELELRTLEIGPPIFEEFEWTAEPPTLTEEQKAQLEWGMKNTHLPGPARDVQAVEIAGPVPGTEVLMADARSRSGQPLLPGDPLVFRQRTFGGIIPAGDGSNVMESSVGIAGRFGFFTGNWFAARTMNDGGFTWSYVSPWTNMPDFCCDQIAIYDEARDIHLWLRMGLPDANWQNVFKLSVSYRKPVEPGWWWTYTFPSAAFYPNEWWDYPHIQLGARYMYLSWNMFDANGFWTRTMMLMISLDDLAAAAVIPLVWYETSDWFTFVPVQGAYHVMYWASNWGAFNPNGIGIWRISEDFISSGGATGFFDFRERLVAQWSFAQAHCPTAGPDNWLGRTDDRLLTGARFTIQNTDIKIPGRKIVAWWWNVAEGGNFPQPYIDGAAFYEDTLTQVAGVQGRPYMWNPDLCFGYPSITPNKRQDLGGVFNWANADNGWKPRNAYIIRDDYGQSLPGGVFYNFRNSQAMPIPPPWNLREIWGDYNTCREFEPTQKVWVAGTHFIPTDVNCWRCSVPIYLVFGRERDYESWWRWRKK